MDVPADSTGSVGETTRIFAQLTEPTRLARVVSILPSEIGYRSVIMLL